MSKYARFRPDIKALLANGPTREYAHVSDLYNVLNRLARGSNPGAEAEVMPNFIHTGKGVFPVESRSSAI